LAAEKAPKMVEIAADIADLAAATVTFG